MTTAEYHTAARGQSKKLQLMNMINDCMRHASNRDEFIALMESEGYKVRWEKKRKNITYTTPSGWRCRDRLLFGDKYLKEMMEYEFRIRAEITYGRAHGAEPSRAYEIDDSGSDACAFSDTAASYGPGVERPAGPDGVAGAIRPGADRVPADGQQPHGEPAYTGAGGGTADSGEADDSSTQTGWEKEREAFLASQNQTAADRAAHTAPVLVGGHPGGAGGGSSVVGAVVQLGNSLELLQRTAPVRDSTTMRHHRDGKVREEEREKKIALGHREDDYEEEPTWQQTM